jgi:hypothetical protein
MYQVGEASQNEEGPCRAAGILLYWDNTAEMTCRERGRCLMDRVQPKVQP